MDVAFRIRTSLKVETRETPPSFFHDEHSRQTLDPRWVLGTTYTTAHPPSLRPNTYFERTPPQPASNMLAVRSRRYRSSTSASGRELSKASEILQALLDKLATTVRSAKPAEYPNIEALLEHARQIHQHVAAAQPPSPPQDDFRRLNGFQALLDVLKAFSGFYNPQKRTVAERKSLFDLIHMVLAVISTNFRGHPGNRRYFQDRAEGGGWEALEQIIASIGVGDSDADLWTNSQLFGKLLSFALDDQRLDQLCGQLIPAPNDDTPREEPSDGDEDVPAVTKKEDPRAVDLGAMDQKIKDIIRPTTVIQNPEIFRTIVGFWESIPRRRGAPVNPVSMIVLNTLLAVASASSFNLSAIHGTGALSRFLRLLFAQDCVLADEERQKVLPLCKSLMSLGIDQLADAQFLLKSDDPAASEFCLSMAEQYRGPAFIQFDLSLHGHGSVELPTLGRPFPPPSAPGYSFTTWVKFDRFDPRSHTTLFGVFDSTQTCFLLAYIERDTKNFILQTSVTSSRPSVRFKSVTFKEGAWYHIAIVHRRPKTLSTSKASLYVNGEFVEQIRSAYPNPPPPPPPPPLSNASTESFASFTSSSSKTNPVQAFLGTPRDLSTQIGPGLVLSKWSLASAHLFEDIMSDDFLAVHFRLGPRYQGNFQDCLGGFQTYEASASLGLRNETFHVGKEESSDILKAIRDKASTIMPESKVLMSTLPRAVFRTDGKFMDSLLFRSLSKNAAGSLFHSTTKNGTAVAINAAVPCINDALVRLNGVSLLTGDPVLATPFYFDDNLWRLGGFTSVALKLVERASTAEELQRSVELMLICINSSWRNSEAMERDNGYAILSMLLRAKLGYSMAASDNPSWRLQLTSDERNRLSFRLLSLVLHFVGYNSAEPLDSFILNPLAYRILLIDPDTWRKSAPRTQELYYKQFMTFAQRSKHHQFNSRRLLRMSTFLAPMEHLRFGMPVLITCGAGIIKRLLDALKAETVSEDILPHFMESFETLVKCNYSPEVHRSLALFITYAFHTPAISVSRTPKPGTLSHSSTPGPGIMKRPTLDLSSGSPSSGTKPLTKKQLGIKILEMYTRMLCTKGNVADIRKFAKTVTNKVCTTKLRECNGWALANQFLVASLSACRGRPRDCRVWMQDFGSPSRHATIGLHG